NAAPGVAHDKTLNGAVLASDADADTLTYSRVADVSHGTLTLNSNGSFAYTPTAGYSGTDSFTYRVSDGLLSSNIATVTIAVTESAPVAGNATVSVSRNKTLNYLVSASDADVDTL